MPLSIGPFAYANPVDKCLVQIRRLLLISGPKAHYDLPWRGLPFGRPGLSWTPKSPGKHTTLGESSGAMTRTGKRRIPVFDCVETVVVAARVAVGSATRFASHLMKGQAKRS